MNTDMREIEVTIDEVKHVIHIGELVQQLEDTPVFKELITDGYFKTEAARLVMLKADPTMQTPEKQAGLEKDMLGISVLGEFLRNRKMLARMAQDSLEAHERTREELRAEA